MKKYENLIIVKTTTGNFGIQADDRRSGWGFVVFDEDRGYDGGFGFASSWEAVNGSEKLPDWVKELLEMLEEEDEEDEENEEDEEDEDEKAGK